MARGEEGRGGNRKDRWKRKERDMGGEASTNDVLPPLGQDLWVLFRGEEKDRYTRSIYAKQPASCILYRGWLYLSVSRLRGYLSSSEASIFAKCSNESSCVLFISIEHEPPTSLKHSFLFFFPFFFTTRDLNSNSKRA